MRHFAALIKNAPRKFNFLIDSKERKTAGTRMMPGGRRQESRSVCRTNCNMHRERPNRTQLKSTGQTSPVPLPIPVPIPVARPAACRVTCLAYISIRAACLARWLHDIRQGGRRRSGRGGFNLVYECECECFTLHMPRA